MLRRSLKEQNWGFKNACVFHLKCRRRSKAPVNFIAFHILFLHYNVSQAAFLQIIQSVMMNTEWSPSVQCYLMAYTLILRWQESVFLLMVLILLMAIPLSLGLQSQNWIAPLCFIVNKWHKFLWMWFWGHRKKGKKEFACIWKSVLAWECKEWRRVRGIICLESENSIFF